jgi:hypothetical protein
MSFRTLRDEVIHLNSSIFKRDAKKSASGTQIVEKYCIENWEYTAVQR